MCDEAILTSNFVDTVFYKQYLRSTDKAHPYYLEGIPKSVCSVNATTSHSFTLSIKIVKLNVHFLRYTSLEPLTGLTMAPHKLECKPLDKTHVARVSISPPLTSTNDVLNEDVLLMIVSYLAAPDIHFLSATSRQLSYVARPRVLAKLVIKRFHEFDKAYELYMSDGPGRLEYLRELKTWLGDRFVKRIAVSFADLLEKAPNLQHIVLNNAETWL
ncbi:predicted protein [Postia placenta Mad-698-R]|uniref:F-box domain-containing protein n=1 Tax=Postia placenta MAD-698-R-SB12 TaxID=670580 RepID=A0A1X6N1J7_9APHY|nr:hypothetical protein POSPLADRAFT_1142389 [Postia placenta MAD-698-R-SB12]EED77756.1 predicted protein [Postia placenta Mad-698-R]OSX62501.1 hypothetical protein POSPLADRAFT_1142389 [Postia placenta MAD-698-R-SB12]